MNDIIKKSKESLIEMKRLQIQRLELEIENIKTELKEPPQKSAFQEWSKSQRVNAVLETIEGNAESWVVKIGSDEVENFRKEGFNFALECVVKLLDDFSFKPSPEYLQEQIEQLKEP